MKAQKLNEMIRKGEPAVRWRTWRSSRRNTRSSHPGVQGGEVPEAEDLHRMAKTIPVSEMEKLFLTHTR